MKTRLIILIIVTVLAVLLALTIMIVIVTISSVSDGNGIGEWTGTAEGMERQVEVFGFSFNVDNIPTGNSNECWYQDDNGTMVPCLVHSDTLNLDPDLSPSFAFDFAFGFLYHTILPLVGLGLGISALFLVPHFILKRKNIPSKPYLSLILAGLLLYFFIPHVIGILHTFTIIFSQPEQIPTWVFNYQFVFVLIPIIVCMISGITLYKSPVIRKLLKK